MWGKGYGRESPVFKHERDRERERGNGGSRVGVTSGEDWGVRVWGATEIG